MLFQQLNLSEPILRALTNEGYERPTPIQAQSIPLILNGHDILACAQTGTGKTASFALPLLQLLQDRPNDGMRHTRMLILTPTRELAIQIGESFRVYGKYTPVTHSVLFGGVSSSQQIKALKSSPDILVATPGRLLDLVSQGAADLSEISTLVLDEADRMLDMGFIHDVKKIISKVPVKRQTLFFSATMPEAISGLAHSILRNPVRIEVTPVSSTAETIRQSVYPVNKQDKAALLVHLLKDTAMASVLVFTRTKHGADKLVKTLNRADIRANAIHGNKSQNARQNALAAFKNGGIRILVATDIAARGIDVDDLRYVINFELPNLPETYVHRIGRTGRAGLQGTAYSFCDQEELPYLKDINKLTAQSISMVNDHPFTPGQVANEPLKPAPAKVSIWNRFRPKQPKPAMA